MSSTNTIVASVVVACVGSYVSAGIVNISQTRAVQARVGYEPNIDSSTIDVGPWTSVVSQRGSVLGGEGVATQNSLVSDTRFTGSGSVVASDGIQAGSNGGARSYCIVTFDVTAPTDYRLVGRWNVTHDFFNSNRPTATMRFERLSPSPMVFHNSFFYDNSNNEQTDFRNSGSVNAAGTLPVGRYRFEIFMDLIVGANPGYFTGNGSYEFDLVVPSPGSVAVICLGGLLASRRRR